METFISEALVQSKESVARGGFPAGVVVVKEGKIIGRGISIGNKIHDPTSHGEIAAIRDACKNIESSSLEGVTVYSSLEPCSMCLSAFMWASVPKVVYACSKSRVSPEYYGGEYTTSDLNNAFLKPIELVHVSQFEEEAMKVISDWESTWS